MQFFSKAEIGGRLQLMKYKESGLKVCCSEPFPDFFGFRGTIMTIWKEAFGQSFILEFWLSYGRHMMLNFWWDDQFKLENGFFILYDFENLNKILKLNLF